MKIKLSLLFLCTFCSFLFAQQNEVWSKMIGSSYLEDKGYNVLQRLCDEAGGRVLGSPINERAMSILKEELAKAGLESRSETFSIPGWERGDDEVLMTSPALRRLQAVALGYVNTTPAFETGVVYAGFGFNDDYKTLEAKGKIALVTSERPQGKEPLLRYEQIDIAAANGAKAIFFINEHPGVLNLAGTGNFQGTPALIPAFSLTYEEGMWIKRLLDKNIEVKSKVTTRSKCKEIESANIVYSMPGKTKGKIVIGAHFDGWDLSQGAIDNGLGSAILFDVARLMKQFSADNYFTIDFVWFNGEEFGLWGAKKYVEMHHSDKIAAMINMDMTGSPKGFNVMGFEEFIPFFENLRGLLNGFDLSGGVVNIPYTNSDHIPFMFEGIPTFSLSGRLDEEMGRYYHSSGDSFDKVNRKYLSEDSAVMSIMLKELSSYEKLDSGRKSLQEMADLFRKFHLDERLKRQKEWIYGN